jgi:chromosome segregation ATPase
MSTTIFQKIKRAVAPLTGKELVLYDQDAKQELRNQQKILDGIEIDTDNIDDSIPKIKTRLNSISQKEEKTKKEIDKTKELIEKYSENGDVEMLTSYQRQLILLQDKLEYYKGSKVYLSDSLMQSQLILREAQITGEILQERIEDAKLCFEMSGQIKVIGGALAAFGKMANKSKSEPFDLSQRIKGLKASINEIHGGRLMALEAGSTGGKK